MVDQFAVLGPRVEAMDRVDDRTCSAAGELVELVDERLEIVHKALHIAAAHIAEPAGTERRPFGVWGGRGRVEGYLGAWELKGGRGEGWGRRPGVKGGDRDDTRGAATGCDTPVYELMKWPQVARGATHRVICASSASDCPQVPDRPRHAVRRGAALPWT